MDRRSDLRVHHLRSHSAVGIPAGESFVACPASLRPRRKGVALAERERSDLRDGRCARNRVSAVFRVYGRRNGVFDAHFSGGREGNGGVEERESFVGAGGNP